MNIVVTVRNVYGNELIYPVSDAAKVLAKLTGKKTLSLEALQHGIALGHTVECSGTDATGMLTRRIASLAMQAPAAEDFP